MEDAEQFFSDKDQPISELRRKKFKKNNRTSKYPRSKGYRFLLYDDAFQLKLKEFREQFGRMRSKHRETLEEISLKINSLERRLSNAKSARDAYIDYLKLKYPLWKPMISSYAGPPRKEETLSPLDTIWQTVMTHGNYTAKDPMISYYQTQKDVQELAVQMRELQIRLAHQNSMSVNYPQQAPIEQPSSYHMQPSFYAYEQSFKPPMNDSMPMSTQKEDHLLQEISTIPTTHDSTNYQQHNSDKSVPKKPINHETPPATEIIKERTVIFESAVEDKKPEPPRVVSKPSTSENKSNNSTSQIMNLLTKKSETTDDSDDDIGNIVSTNTTSADNTKIKSQAEPKKSTDTKGSLSMYLKKIADNDSSSSEDIFAPVKKIVRMDSDSDFFG